MLDSSFVKSILFDRFRSGLSDWLIFNLSGKIYRYNIFEQVCFCYSSPSDLGSFVFKLSDLEASEFESFDFSKINFTLSSFFVSHANNLIDDLDPFKEVK